LIIEYAAREDAVLTVAKGKLQELSEAPFSWQQVELPQTQAIVTQFDCLRYKCKECNRRSMGSLPKNIPFSAFGPKLMAFVACLTGRFHLSKREAITLIKDLYDIDLSEGSIINVEENVSNALGEVYGKIYRYVIEGDLCRYFDETSWRNSGKPKAQHITGSIPIGVKKPYST
jgi:transposase